MDRSRLMSDMRRGLKKKVEEEPDPPSKQMTILLERKKNADRQKAQLHWKKLKNAIRKTTQAVAEADIKELVIAHGIHHHRKLNHPEKIMCALFINDKKEYVTSDGQRIRVFLEDGRKKEMYTPEEPIDNMVYCKHTQQFVGWITGQDELFLMNGEFEIISQSRVPSKINLAAYNQNTCEFITVSPGYIVCWAFRYGARHLIPRKMTKVRFNTDGSFRHLVLEETASRQQKCFLSYDTGVVAYNVFEGRELVYKKDLHERAITALAYFNPLKYLITGAQDGTIKVWDTEWYLKMVFVGHTSCVNILRIYPEGPCVISASLDCTIRVWNLDSCDEMDRASLDEPVLDLGTELNYDMFFTFANRQVDLWKIQHLYNIHTAIGQRITSIKQTSHPSYPIRAMTISRDNAIRVITPPSGEIMTTLLLSKTQVVVDAAYAIAEDTLFVSLISGDILKVRTDINPSQIVGEWQCTDEREACNYLLVYEYVPDFKSDAWAAFKRGLATKSISKDTGENGAAEASNERNILLGGRKDGYICVFNWETGDVDFKIEAHGIKGVLSMIGNSKQDQLISAGKDNIIKVWRLYPYAEEALAPLMSFYCAHTPAHMTMLKTNLCVAFQDNASATYSIVIYNLKDRSLTGEDEKQGREIHHNRFDHKPDDDHVDIITGLASCQRMKLYASSSLDGTIRIWDERNNLIRLLKLKTMPYSVGFCSNRGDLLVGIGLHLHKIPYQSYLPKGYKFKMVSMRFVDPRPEKCLPLDDEVLKKLTKREITRLRKSHSSFKYDHFEDILTKEEEEEINRELKIKQAAFAVISAREKELQMMRDGQMGPKKKPSSTPETRDDAFKNYMKMYYDRPRLSVPPDDPFPKDTLERIVRGPEPKPKIPFKPEREPSGFFPPPTKSPRCLSREKSTVKEKTPAISREPSTVVPLQPSYPNSVSKDGFVPNSVLVKILWPPPPPPPKKELEDRWMPKALTARQLAELSGQTYEEPEEEEIPEPSPEPMYFDYEDDESVRESPAPSEEKVPSPVPRSPTPPPPPIKKDTKEVKFSKKPTVHVFEKSPSPTLASREASSLMSKFQDMMAKPPESKESDDDDSTITTTPRSPRTPELVPPSKTVKPVKPSKPIISAADTKPKPPQPSEPPQPPIPATPAVPPTPAVPLTPAAPATPKKEAKPATPLVKEKPILSEPKPAPPPAVQKETPVVKPKVPHVVPVPVPKKAPSPPPRAFTPLPIFITQFKGSDWFDKFYPNCNEENMPKPWLPDNFAIMLSRLIRIAEYSERISITDALAMLFTQEDMLESTAITLGKMLMAVLNLSKDPPTCMVEDQKSFILASLRALHKFGLKDKEFITELMVQFLDGDKEVRGTTVEIMSASGLQDPHKFFPKELDSWDIWNVEEEDRKADLRKMCQSWLDRWMTSYKLHLSDTIDRMKKGQNIHGKLTAGGRKRSTPPPGKGLLKKSVGGAEAIPEDQETVTTLPRGTEFIPSDHRKQSVTLTFDKPPDPSLVDSATFIDALNYFVDMMMEKQLEQMKKGGKRPPGAKENVVQAKNTVLVLPKLPHKPALVRLGETHTSTCRPHRETNLHVDYRSLAVTNRGYQPQPGQLSGFAPSINLPMKTLYINPFPSYIDELDTRFQEPVLITLKSSQKYFIPTQSIVPSLEEPIIPPAH